MMGFGQSGRRGKPTQGQRHGLRAAVLCLGLLAALAGSGRADDAARVARRYAAPPQASEAGESAVAPRIPGIPDAAGNSGRSAGPVAATAERSYSLERAVTRALTANPRMQDVRAVLSGRQASRRQALADFGPVGTVSYVFRRTDSRSHTTQRLVTPQGSFTARGTTGHWQNAYTLELQATQPLFTGFRLLSAYQRAALNTAYAAANIRSTELSLINAVQQAFLALLQARANARSEKDAVIRLAAQYKVAQAYYDEGIKAHLDMLQAEADLATAEQRLLAAENAVRIRTAQLNTLLNLPLDQATDYVGELAYIPFTTGLEECLALAYKQRPDLAMGLKSVQMAERNVMIAASPLSPQVQAQATETWKGDRPDLRVKDQSGGIVPEQRTLTLSASLRAWDWGSTIFATRSARETVSALQADLAKLRLDAGATVKTAYLTMEDAAKRITVARTAVEAAREGYRSAVALYQEQIGTNTEVLNAQSRLSTAETTLTQALADYQSALSDLYAAIGVKNPSLAAR